MTPIKSLECVVRQTVSDKKCKVLSEITIFLGREVVARKTIGGDYNATTGMREFKLNPKSFERELGWEIASQLKLVA